jgi:hypothetical protein
MWLPGLPLMALPGPCPVRLSSRLAPPPRHAIELPFSVSSVGLPRSWPGLPTMTTSTSTNDRPRRHQPGVNGERTRGAIRLSIITDYPRGRLVPLPTGEQQAHPLIPRVYCSIDQPTAKLHWSVDVDVIRQLEDSSARRFERRRELRQTSLCVDRRSGNCAICLCKKLWNWNSMAAPILSISNA